MFIKLIAPVVALGIGAVLLTPGTTEGTPSTLGFSLSQNQRDFRTFNNFTDSQSNNNIVPHANFPGAQGAVMAVWKACIEWGSELHGNGNGDPAQNGGLGSGGANFDASWQGEVSTVGGINDNTHSALSGGSGGVLAFTESPSSNGWRIRYYENWTWNDGPGTSIGGQSDLQGVACHEYGHALGLGHSTSGSATMAPSIGGGSTSERSITSDDIQGLKAIYGTKSSTKPKITGVSTSGGQITVTGTGFNSTGNQIWFTRGSGSGNGTPIKAISLNSSGTSLTASIPANAGPGDVLVRRNSTAHSGLSNAWPTDLSGGSTGGGAPNVTSVTPSSIDAVVIDGPQGVTLIGSSFTGTTGVSIDGVALPIFPPSFAIPNDNTLTFSMPSVDKLGPIDIEITNASGTTTTSINVVSNSTPTVELANSNPAFLIQAAGLTVKIGGDVGDYSFLVFSPELIDTVLPGLTNVPLSIGNNNASLFVFGPYLIGASGHVDLNFPMSGFPPGLTVNVQSAHALFANSYALPLVVSNVQSGLLLF